MIISVFNFSVKQTLNLLSIDDVTYVYIQNALCWQNTVYVIFRRAKRHVVMLRLHTLSSWVPKHKGFAWQYARESCYGFWVTSEVTSSIKLLFGFSKWQVTKVFRFLTFPWIITGKTVLKKEARIEHPFPLATHTWYLHVIPYPNSGLNWIMHKPVGLLNALGRLTAHHI